MTNRSALWHPCSQMKDYEQFPPLTLTKARGCYLHLHDGQKIIDAIASWWCKTLGHQHPQLRRALHQQATKFEHVILANVRYKAIEKLSQQLVALLPGLAKVFYAGEGSSAIEIALKMSLQAQQQRGMPERRVFIALKNGYHGETLGALSMSDTGIYRKPYEPLLLKPIIIEDMPYVHDVTAPLWQDCPTHWLTIEAALTPYTKTAAAIIVEPLLQGAGGMRIYSQDLLKRLRAWATQHHVYLIADEIMTGIARTGKMLACDYAAITPDFLCLGKGLTAGWLPLSAVVTSQEIYQLFYDDYASHKAFLHSHTYTGNALAVSIALEVLKIIRQEDFCTQAAVLGAKMYLAMQAIAAATGRLVNVRSLGAMVAADLVCDNSKRRLGYEVYQEAVKRGALLRPLGNTIYWLPPLTMSDNVLAQLQKITQAAIMAVK